MKTEALLWAGLLIAPIGWFLNLEANFALAPLACAGGGRPLLYLVSAITFVLAVLSGGISWTQWRSVGRDHTDQPSPEWTRRRAMAAVGIGLSSLFVITIVAQAIPNFMMAGCE